MPRPDSEAGRAERWELLDQAGISQRLAGVNDAATIEAAIRAAVATAS